MPAKRPMESVRMIRAGEPIPELEDLDLVVGLEGVEALLSAISKYSTN